MSFGSTTKDLLDTADFFDVSFAEINFSNFPRKSNFRVIISDMCCNSRRKKQIFSQPLDASAPKAQRSIISSYATSPTELDNKLALSQNSQHSTARVLRFSGKLAKQAQLATSTNYNSARNNFSGYPFFKSNITTFSHRKTARDAGQITPCTWAFHCRWIIFSTCKTAESRL